METESGVGKSEAKLRKWTGVWLGRRTPGAQAELSRCAPGVGSPAAAGLSVLAHSLASKYLHSSVQSLSYV